MGGNTYGSSATNVYICCRGGVGALRAPDFDGPDAGLGCDGAVNNKDSPSLFSLSPPPPPPFPFSPSLQIYKRPDGGGLRPKVEGRQRWVGGWEVVFGA